MHAIPTTIVCFDLAVISSDFPQRYELDGILIKEIEKRPAPKKSTCPPEGLAYWKVVDRVKERSYISCLGRIEEKDLSSTIVQAYLIKDSFGYPPISH